jgi:hypothetical protein
MFTQSGLRWGGAASPRRYTYIFQSRNNSFRRGAQPLFFYRAASSHRYTQFFNCNEPLCCGAQSLVFAAGRLTLPHRGGRVNGF